MISGFERQIYVDERVVAFTFALRSAGVTRLYQGDQVGGRRHETP